MTIKIQIRRGTASAWTTADSVLSAGEIGYETDTKKLKIGDGTTAWTSLAYFPSAANVSFAPTGSISASTVALALAELDTEKLAATAAFGGQVTGTYGSITVANTHGSSGVTTHHTQSHDHSNAADGTVTASSITFTPTGTLAATNVQTAIAEAASEAVQSATHIDTDTATTALHHTLGTGANQAAAGNHGHSTLMPVLYTTSDQSISSSITLTTATPFNITVAANAITTIDYYLPLIAGAGAFKVGWTIPAGGATLTWATTDLTAGSPTLTGTAVTVASSTAVQFVRIRAYYVGGSQSGTVSFQWAQNTSNATATVLKKGAWAQYITQ